jgi:Fe-S-cluster containining protein
MSKDATRDFLEKLPKLAPDERFRFGCHPAVPCFNACCSGLTMPLTPYDVLRLCAGLAMSSEEFMEDYAVVGCYEDTGFPLLHLRMDPGPDRPCPFVGERGCGVYPHRSSACRAYPLGRATRPADAKTGSGLVEQYFLVREEHCGGFAGRETWTPDEWLKDQGLEPYNRMNDRYMLLMARYKSLAGNAVLSEKHATMALLCLYQADRFLELVRSTSLLSRVRLKGEYAGKAREETERAILENAEERLWFAFDWVELVLFGSSANVEPALAPTGH